jgi:hypothetical protein
MLRKFPSEIDEMDYRDYEEFVTVVSAMGDKNPFMVI